MRAYSAMSLEEKEKVYSLARAGVTDDCLCERFELSHDCLLLVIEDAFMELQSRRGFSGMCRVKAGSMLRDED